MFNRLLQFSLHIIKKLVNLYLKIDDSSSEEERSISSHKKYVPSSKEEEQTRAAYGINEREQVQQTQNYNTLQGILSDFNSIIDSYNKTGKILKSDLDWLVKIVTLHPELPDLEIRVIRVLNNLKEKDNEKGATK